MPPSTPGARWRSARRPSSRRSVRPDHPRGTGRWRFPATMYEAGNIHRHVQNQWRRYCNMFCCPPVDTVRCARRRAAPARSRRRRVRSPAGGHDDPGSCPDQQPGCTGRVAAAHRQEQRRAANMRCYTSRPGRREYAPVSTLRAGRADRRGDRRAGWRERDGLRQRQRGDGGRSWWSASSAPLVRSSLAAYVVSELRCPARYQPPRLGQLVDRHHARSRPCPVEEQDGPVEIHPRSRSALALIPTEVQAADDLCGAQCHVAPMLMCRRQAGCTVGGHPGGSRHRAQVS